METTTTPTAAVVSKAAMHDAMRDVTAVDMTRMLGIVYSAAPEAFTAALTKVRPDLPQAPKAAPPECGCRPGDTATWDHVRVQGHTPDCEDAQPRRYLFLENGKPRTGTLAAYASSWEYATQYGHTLPSAEVRTWDHVYDIQVEQVSRRPDEDGWVRFRIAAGNESVGVQVCTRD